MREQLKWYDDKAVNSPWFAENDPEGVAFEYEVLECGGTFTHGKTW
jgi:hypothetical protein